MLPRSARLTAPNDFARTTKSGSRASSKFLVTYLYLTTENMPVRCGLIINKNVGGSVVRHKVARQVRHELRKHLSQFSLGSLLVVRVLPGASKTNISSEVSRLISEVRTKALNSKMVQK